MQQNNKEEAKRGKSIYYHYWNSGKSSKELGHLKVDMIFYSLPSKYFKKYHAKSDDIYIGAACCIS